MEWLNLALRWLHVVAAAFWIGQTAFFAWLDRRLSIEGADRAEGAETWMVHSGGYYRVEKLAFSGPEPRILHWFRWEALLTFLSGLMLLTVVYYLGGALITPDAPLAKGWAIAIGVATLVFGWPLYDLLWVRLVPRSGLLAAVLGAAALAALCWGLDQVISGRAAYIHVGALMGTIMTANVWQRILPAQRRSLAAAREGKPADPAWAATAKERSRHNTYLALPVFLIMLSNHFPTVTYGRGDNWLVLGGIVLVGCVARWLIDRAEAR